MLAGVNEWQRRLWRHCSVMVACALLLGLLVSTIAAEPPKANAGKLTPNRAAATVAPLSTPPLPIPNPRRSAAGQDAGGQDSEGQSAGGTAQNAGAPSPGAGGQTAGGDTIGGSPPIAPPAPKSAEAEYMASLDQLIAPIRDFVPRPEDAARIKDVLRLQASDPAAARQAKAQISDPAARKLTDWLMLRAGLGDPQEYGAFLAANPSWPERQTLARRAEEALFTRGGSAQKIKAFFKDKQPRTGAGFAALASAYQAEKDEAKAREFAVKAWTEHVLAGSLEHGFLERFGPLLTEADHRRRIDHILVDEVRFSAERSDRVAIARRVLSLLPEVEQKKVEARIAIFLRAKTAGQMLAALPADAAGQPIDWGLAYQKVQHYRRTGHNDEAWKILLATPTDPAIITSPDDWWAERRAAAYDAIRAGQPETAYALVQNVGPLSVNPLKDQSFLAGWIALRLLDRKEEALRHLEASRAAADGPLSLSRADYWSGRALAALGREVEARSKYAEAAKHFDTFHGQLARHKLASAGPITIPATLPAMPTAEDVKRFNANEAIKAAVIIAKLGIDRSIKRTLFGQLRNTLTTEAEVAMLAHLASALGDPQTSLRVGKTGIARGMNLIIYAYPIHAFPEYRPLRDPPEPAMLLGIARQETEFNNSIISTAGARGLLQVMPVTAQHICRDHKIKCDLPRLITDNSYNAMIASAYIGDRMADFRGNYVLTLAGYNAGPGRARQWIREHGDPRDPSVDPIDWIEHIPIEETREYVKKVLSNLQVYRARLGDEAALRLEQDLVRTIGGRRAAAPVAIPAETNAQAR